VACAVGTLEGRWKTVDSAGSGVGQQAQRAPVWKHSTESSVCASLDLMNQRCIGGMSRAQIVNEHSSTSTYTIQESVCDGVAVDGWNMHCRAQCLSVNSIDLAFMGGDGWWPRIDTAEPRCTEHDCCLLVECHGESMCKGGDTSSPPPRFHSRAHMRTTVQPHPPALCRCPRSSGCYCAMPITASSVEDRIPVAAFVTGLGVRISHWIPRPCFADAPSSDCADNAI
jgi:hypothetical protein